MFSLAVGLRFQTTERAAFAAVGRRSRSTIAIMAILIVLILKRCGQAQPAAFKACVQ